MKRHIGRMHSAILKQEYVGEDITGARVHTPVTESDEMNVKDEINDPELFEDSIVVLKIYKLLQRMKIKIFKSYFILFVECKFMQVQMQMQMQV